MRPAFLLALMVFTGALGAFAGNLSPPGAPQPTMRTLQEIFDEVSEANRALGGGDALLFYPHIVEQQGTISNTQYTFDTMFNFVATAPYIGMGLKKGAPSTLNKSAGDVSIRLYLYDSDGQPALSATATQVAFPAVFTIGYATPKASVTLDTLFQAAGGFASSTFTGYAVVSVSSGDLNDVAAQAFTINSRTSPFDLAITPLEPIRIQDTASAAKNTETPDEETKQ